MTWQPVIESIAAGAGAPVGSFISAVPLAGGSINTAYHLSCTGGDYFVKLNSADRLPMFEAEADGLRALAAAGAMRVPAPLSTGRDGHRAWLVTTFVPLSNRAVRGDAQWREAGAALAMLHRHTAAEFGWHRNNWIGSTPQSNRRSGSWPHFFRDERLRPQLELAARNGFRGALQRKGERLMASMERFFAGYTPAPSLLHGDLWGGNFAFDDDGGGVIYDPAVYYGDRETDLAMSRLFGGFPAPFYAGYEAVWPLDKGYGTRQTLYNLYHILNHANLFGGGYARHAEAMLDQLLAAPDCG